MLEEIEDNIGLEGDTSRSEALMDGLDSEADLAENTELVPGEGKLGVLQIRHLDAEVPHQVIVNQC